MKAFIAVALLAVVVAAEPEPSCIVCTTAVTVARRVVASAKATVKGAVTPAFCKIFPDKAYTAKCVELTEKFFDNGVAYVEDNVLNKVLCESMGACATTNGLAPASCDAGMKQKVDMLLDDLCGSLSADLGAVCRKVRKAYGPAINSMASQLLSNLGVTETDMKAMQCPAEDNIPEFMLATRNQQTALQDGGVFCYGCNVFWRLPYYYMFTGPAQTCHYEVFKLPCDLFGAPTSTRSDCRRFVARVFNLIYLPFRFLSSPNTWCGSILNCPVYVNSPYDLGDFTPIPT